MLIHKLCITNVKHPVYVFFCQRLTNFTNLYYTFDYIIIYEYKHFYNNIFNN